MADGTKSAVGEIAKEAGIAALIATLLDALKEGMRNGVKKGAEAAAEKVSQKVAKKFDEQRDEMLAFIRGLAATTDPIASNRLMNRWMLRQLNKPRPYGAHEPYKPGDEIVFIERLTKLYVSLDEAQEEEIRRQMFRWLGRMEEEEFDVFLELLNHDVVIQWMRRAWLWVKEAWKKFYSTDPQTPGLYQQADGKLDQILAPVNQSAKEIRDKLAKQVKEERKGWKRWTSLWSF